ncbi:MAG: hypothetical protein ACE5RQ_02685 [Nitrosopumilus sp.]|uniref:Uncharacterized protein n=1 Tax=Candidatus Nitrosomaritimum aestuariumsis TaxID=3342354 RepID=A0AC60VX07_9ARCH|nr:hypothetical protein [Nitrosopumilaceae archaeon]MBA4460585.1 hypothetical protein [Nitrosopumilaceae archaeon]
MDYPLSVNDDGVNIKPENMEKEHLYHCVFKNKVILLYKDSQDFLNCYEIEEEDLVNQIKNSSNDSDVEKILQSFIDNKDIKN